MNKAEWAAYMKEYRKNMSPYQREITKERQAEYQKRLRKKRVEAGVCVVCGGPRMEGDERLCEKHRMKARLRQRARAQRERRKRGV